jgi:hypothetical protein
MDIVNEIEIKLPIRGELGRVTKTDLCIASQASSRHQLVGEMRKLMESDERFKTIYTHQFNSWTVSREVAVAFLQHIFGTDCTIKLVK